MQKVKIAKIVIVLGILIILKISISLDLITRISEPISNGIVFVAFLIFSIFLWSNSKKTVEEEIENDIW